MRVATPGKVLYRVRGTSVEGDELPPFDFPTREVAEAFKDKAEQTGQKMGWTVHEVEEISFDGDDD
jgi:hypothetical protein